jgi:hypothetical protein
VSDRLKGCWVSFERDMRAEEAGPILGAIRAIRGVGAAEVSVAGPDDWMARERVRSEVKARIHELYESI